YGSGPLNKFDYSACLAASLAYLLVRQHDAVGLLTFDNAVQQKLPAATGRVQLANVVTLLESCAPQGTTDVKGLFHQLAVELGRRSLVVLISDLLADPDDIVAGLEHICHSGHELVLLHVMDEHEWSFPFVETRSALAWLCVPSAGAHNPAVVCLGLSKDRGRTASAGRCARSG
ncbi:MAG: hypothetical protein KKI08_20375, partial [Armatimonadetes bacterium]|nr:hypothetical protein [Armatimonadota bacterium]